MKKFGLRLKGWLVTSGFWSSASSWMRGFSSARTSIKFLIAIVALMLPLIVFVMVSKLPATNTIAVTTLHDAVAKAQAETDVKGNRCVASTGTDLINSTPGFGTGGDPCANNPCLNGGQCIDDMGIAVCICRYCWIGGDCEAPNVGPCNDTITVNTYTDDSTPGDGSCSLRKAINNFNNDFQGDTTGGDCTYPLDPNSGNNLYTINFAASVNQPIILSSPLPAINFVSSFRGGSTSLTIDGTGQAIVLDGANSYGVLAVDSGAPITLNELTLQNGNNSSGSGGGINNTGTLTVSNSTLSGNTAAVSGGGIYNDGTLTITNSTFFDNSAPASGGGEIFNDSSGTISVNNCTFSSDSPGANSGGGIYNDNLATSATLTNSILVNSGSGGNCAGMGVTNGAYNIADDASCAFGNSTAANGNTIGDSVTDANVALGALAE